MVTLIASVILGYVFYILGKTVAHRSNSEVIKSIIIPGLVLGLIGWAFADGSSVGQDDPDSPPSDAVIARQQDEIDNFHKMPQAVQDNARMMNGGRLAMCSIAPGLLGVVLTRKGIILP